MKSRPRWMKSVLDSAKTNKARMPWERGLRRRAMISRRKAQTAPVLPPQRAAAG